VVVTPRNSDVTFGINNVSHLFQSIHFETLNETSNKQENSGDEKKAGGRRLRVILRAKTRPA